MTAAEFAEEPIDDYRYWLADQNAEYKVQKAAAEEAARQAEAQKMGHSGRPVHRIPLDPEDM